MLDFNHFSNSLENVQRVFAVTGENMKSTILFTILTVTPLEQNLASHGLPLQDLGPALMLAQTELLTGLSKIAGIIQAVAMIMFFASLVLAGAMIAIGRTEYLLNTLLGATIGGTAWLLVKTLFGMNGTLPAVDIVNF
ncbi:MAG: hypothetical protein AAF353_13385 [Pseudomonadota bacterium]